MKISWMIFVICFKYLRLSDGGKLFGNIFNMDKLKKFQKMLDMPRSYKCQEGNCLEQSCGQDPPSNCGSVSTVSGCGQYPPSNCKSTGKYCWIKGVGSDIPPNAVLAGRDKEGAPLYAGRAFHEGDLSPAKVAPHYGWAFTSYNAVEQTKLEFEILISNCVSWEPDKDGLVPPRALPVGRTKGGEQLFMGRTAHNGTLTPGKIHPGRGGLFIPYNYKEYKYRNYEVLVLV